MALACFRAAPLLAATAGLGLATGCIIEGDDPELATTEQAIGGGCGWNKCGTNGPTLSEKPFHELNEVGLANDEGFKVEGMYFGVSPWKWRIDVVGGEIRAKFLMATKTGAAIQGGVLKVIGSDSTKYTIQVVEAGHVSTYPGTVQHWAYRLHWIGGTQKEWINLCSNPDPDISESESLGQAWYSAVVFEGTRYDGNKLWIRDDVVVDNWFNIGCTGHILSKLYITHHTKATSLAPYETTSDQQQTMIRMLAADYCGTGKSFTIGGHLLHWTDDKGWFAPPTAQYLYNAPWTVKLEARWSSRGATCLETPRLTGTTDPDAIDAFGPNVGTEILDMIAHECELPPVCTDIESDDPNKPEGKHLVSGNPYL